MAYIEKIPPEAAVGTLKEEYQAAIRRAGRIWEIVAVQSQSPETLRASIGMYTTAMFGESELSRAQREMIAVVTSKLNDCHY
ncbi:MAG: carboxymuconolactone decarboxylase family protein [Acidimicrobiia bacterium]